MITDSGSADSVRPIRVLFVCLGNICRSPLAEAVFRQAVDQAGLSYRFDIDSAGTSAYHIGEPPDARSAEVAARRGVHVRGASRQLEEEDIRSFDYVIAMDRDNLADVREVAESVGADARIHLLREFDIRADGDLDVPDPYYGGPRGFEDVHDLVERSCIGLFHHLRQEHEL